eukprot:5561825-Prymnesium_polylepis.1
MMVQTCATQFLSHSWHDEGRLKWAVLREWANKFAEEEGRQPTIWLGKARLGRTARTPPPSLAPPLLMTS